MSNLGQYYGKGFPIGSTVSAFVSSENNTYTAPDGSVWYNPAAWNTELPYDSSYGDLPEQCYVSAKLLNGPVDGQYLLQSQFINKFSLACDPTNQIYITNSIFGTAAGAYYYHTSDGGATWTERLFPNSLSYVTVKYIGGRFIAFSVAATNGCIISTDGITWTSYNKVADSITSINDFIQGNTNNIFYLNQSSAQYSLDNGQTWTASTGWSGGGTFPSQGTGMVSWNASAGLFIARSSTVGSYITSPTGATWTARNPASFVNWTGGLFGTSQTLFASSPTKTIAFGYGGAILSSTDCLTWSGLSFVAKNLNSTPAFAYYDGTRFVVTYPSRIFYSSDGITWTEGVQLFQSMTQAVYTGGRMHLLGNYQNVRQPIYYVDDVTDTTKRYIAYKSQSLGNQSTFLMRIK